MKNFTSYEKCCSIRKMLTSFLNAAEYTRIKVQFWFRLNVTEWKCFKQLHVNQSNDRYSCIDDFLIWCHMTNFKNVKKTRRSCFVAVSGRWIFSAFALEVQFTLKRSSCKDINTSFNEPDCSRKIDTWCCYTWFVCDMKFLFKHSAFAQFRTVLWLTLTQPCVKTYDFF